MDEPRPDQHLQASGRIIANEIRGNAMSMLIGGAICLYFGFTLLIDAPASADEQATQTWFAVDRGFRTSFLALGAGFLIAAAWSMTGRSAALLMSAVVEVVFALLMLLLAIETTLEARADGRWDAFAILFLILFVIGLSGALRVWQLHGAAARLARPVEPRDDE